MLDPRTELLMRRYGISELSACELLSELTDATALSRLTEYRLCPCPPETDIEDVAEEF